MAKPFMKWPGGKKQLLPEILKRLPSANPEAMVNYHEPFLGGGAVFFALEERNLFQKAYLNDVNPRLALTYKAIRDDVAAVEFVLKTLKDDRDSYEKVREEFNREGRTATFEKTAYIAAYMLYLNKLCFNGLYRENLDGGMNSPYADPEQRSKIPFLESLTPNLGEAAKALTRASISCDSFEAACEAAYPGDFVYLDPPYLPIQDKAFTAYTKKPFGIDDHARLALVCRELHTRGVKFLASNADVPKVREMYEGFTIETIPARRSINSRGTGRGPVNEVLIRNY